MAKILVLDDQPTALAFWWNALARAGHDLTRTSTVEEAILQCNADQYDLMVLDRMMPPMNVFSGTDGKPDVLVGDNLMRDFRARFHLEQVPVIFLTNYPKGDDVDLIKRDYINVEVVGKDTRPRALVDIVNKTLREHSVEAREPSIPDNEFPDIAPYHVTEIPTGKRLRVNFMRCSLGDGIEPSPTGFNTEWPLAAVFEQRLGHEQTCSSVRKLLPTKHPSDLLLGLYWSSSEKEDKLWYRDILFASAPWARYGSDQRKYKGVGEVLMARYLREWMWRSGMPASVEINPNVFGDSGVTMDRAINATQFLKTLGCTYDEGRKICRIDQENAFALLDRVTHYSRTPSTR